MNTVVRFRLTAYLALAIALTTMPLTTNAGSCFVWRVTNTKAPCYLVGTLHALSGHDYPLPAGYYQALRDSQRFVFEMKPDPRSEFHTKFARAATYPKGDYVQNHVHPKMWEIIRVNFGIVSLIGKPVRIGNYYLEHGVEQLRPWAIAYFFYGIPGYSDVHAEYGVDNIFAFEGKRHHKELAGLETEDEHVQVLGGMNDAESESILVDAIYYRDKEKALNGQLRSAWKRGDLVTVGQYLGRDYLLNPTGEQKLLDVRNRKWIPQIKAEFNSGKATSIVVGAGHILGPNGLVGLLKKEGFKFEQL